MRSPRAVASRNRLLIVEAKSGEIGLDEIKAFAERTKPMAGPFVTTWLLSPHPLATASAQALAISHNIRLVTGEDLFNLTQYAADWAGIRSPAS